MSRQCGAVALGTLASILAAGAACAQEGTTALDEIVVVGSRAAGRVVADSPAPVDVISAEALQAQGFADLSRALQVLSPSFN